MKKLNVLVAMTLVLAMGKNIAQADCNCCDEVHKQFDFWVGDWIVKDSLGTVVGENHITKIEDDCVLKEEWTGGSGTTGTSLNYFDKTDGTWNQLWLDNSGNNLKLKGRLLFGKMVLRSELTSSKDIQYYNQITWSRNKNGTVTQLWEAFDASERRLKILFKGIYHRK